MRSGGRERSMGWGWWGYGWGMKELCGKGDGMTRLEARRVAQSPAVGSALMA